MECVCHISGDSGAITVGINFDDGRPLVTTTGSSTVSNDWKVRGIRMASRNRLVLDVEPMYGNLKKYQGEMEFNLDSEQMTVLRQVLAEESEKERRLEIAKAELDELAAEQLETIRAKRKELRAGLGLEGESDLPFWLWDGPH